MNNDERTKEQKDKRTLHHFYGISLNEKRGFIKYEFPTYWASYLVNGDSSGMSDNEIKECDDDTNGIGSCMEVLKDSGYGIYKGMGCDVSTYIFKKYE